MTNIEKRINLLAQLGDYMLSADAGWDEVKETAVQRNSWFNRESIDISIRNIVKAYLDPALLKKWIEGYTLPAAPRKVGIVMAGNIPLVGFHDFLCGYLSGHHLLLKLSSKDAVLLQALIAKLTEWDTSIADQVQVADVLKGCEAYIATGSNNSARYFEQYFARYPHLIRRNRTSVAVLDGTETDDELNALAADVFTYFGLGCRNVTQLCVPEQYDFTKLLSIFDNHEALMLHHKYHNNYDYHLAVYLLNAVPYLTNGTLLLVENDIPFSAVSVLHYRRYKDREAMIDTLKQSIDIQAVIGHGAIPFGKSQEPALSDYADGVDTMQFLCSL